MSDELFKDLPPIHEMSPVEQMTAPGTVGGMFAGAARKVGSFFEAPPTAPAASPMVAPSAPVAEPAPPPQQAPLAPPPPVRQQQPAPDVTQTQTSFTPGIKLPEVLKTAQVDAIDAKEKAAAAANDAEAASARNQALITQQKNNEIEIQQEKDKADALHIQQKADKAQNDYFSAIDNFKANNKVDPNRHDKERGVGGGILAALAQGLGAFGSALTHTPNYAAQILKDAVDADIRAQEHAIDQKREAVGMQGNLVQHFRQELGDHAVAARAAKSVILDRAIGRIDAEMADKSNSVLLARGAALKAAAMDEKAAIAKDNFVHEQGKYVKQTMTAPAQGMSVENQLKVEGLNVYVPQTAKDPKTGKDVETGEYKTYRASSEDDAKKIKQAMVVRDHIKANLQRMSTLVDDTTFKSLPGTTGKKQIDTLADTLRTQFGVLHNLGALSDKDYTIASQLGDPTSFFQRDSTTKQLIGQFGTDIDGMVNAEMKARGLFR